MVTWTIYTAETEPLASIYDKVCFDDFSNVIEV